MTSQYTNPNTIKPIMPIITPIISFIYFLPFLLRQPKKAPPTFTDCPFSIGTLPALAFPQGWMGADAVLS